MTSDPDKISEIMRLAGVPGREMEKVRPALQKMSSTEIDERLNRLEARERRLSNWRAKRGRPMVNDKYASDRYKVVQAADRVGPDLIEVLKEIKLAYGVLEGQFRGLQNAIRVLGSSKHASSRLTVLGRLFAELRNKLNGLSTSDNTYDEAVARQVIAAFDAWRVATGSLADNISSEIGSLLNHPVLPTAKPVLFGTGAVEALARLANTAVRFRPRVFIGANTEGVAISQVLAHQLKGADAQIIQVTSRDRGELSWQNPIVPISSGSTIAIVGDTAHSGKTLSRVVEEAKRRFDTDRVYCMALASSDAAVVELANHCHLVFHYLSFESNPTLDFDAKSGVRIEAGNYTFRKDDKDFRLPADFVHMARDQMSQTFPDSEIPWLPAVPIS
jgi:hypoxanthine phosphoribosyltransferase